MAYGNLKILKQGQAPAVQAAIYTGNAGKNTEVCMFWLHNCGSGIQQAKVGFQEPVSASVIFNELININSTYEVSPKVPFVLSGTGSIYMTATNTGSLNYTIVGREEQ